MTSSTKNSDMIDIDDILDTIKNTFDQPNIEHKLLQPLTPQSTSPQPLVEINSLLLHTDESDSKLSNNEDREGEIILLKSRIEELEIQLANLKTTHEQSLEKHSEMNVTYLENLNAELRYNLAQKVQTINELTEEIEALEKMTTTESKQSNEFEVRIKELEDQNSTLLAENLSYDVQTSEVKELMYYRDREIERLKLEYTHQRDVNDELNDQISVLQIQLANWQIDFEKEREDRSALAGDRETILTQLKYAQRRSEQLENNRGRARQNETCVLM